MDIVEPRTGWKDLPPSNDTGVSADLSRIRIYRNDLAHLNSVNIDDTFFEKSLHRNIGHLLDRLFYLNVDVNKCRKDGASPLFVACQEGNLEIATELLERHAVVNQQLSDGATPLFIACQNGHLPIVELLLQAGADVDRRTRAGSSPIIVSSLMGHKHIVECLLYMNARVDFKIKNDNIEENAMSLARQNRHYEIVRMLKGNDRGVVARMINIALTHKVDWSEDKHCFIKAPLSCHFWYNSNTTSTYMSLDSYIKLPSRSFSHYL
ncbi:unnamed protein product [Mytilus edulis]|uniref:ANK_REP_REGION domain-containing protein n=1 Tax=Mytilus edulis TaxID=6550 RepID=A0A8S3PNH5_MYTED|nr:unnamed protein product [Mytilus edulis]